MKLSKRGGIGENNAVMSDARKQLWNLDKASIHLLP
jgi:hypothetical protein